VFDDIFGDAESVAADLYARATDPNQGSVHDDLVRARLARKIGFDPPESLPWNSYEARRQRLQRDYDYQRSPPPSAASSRTGGVPDFSAEGVPVDEKSAKPATSEDQPQAEDQPEERQSPEQPEQPQRSLAEQAGVAARAAGQAAVIGGVADPLKAAALAPEVKKQAYEQAPDRATLENGGYAQQPQTPEEAEAAGAAYGVAGGPFRSAIKARERQQAAAQEQLDKELAVPPQERPLFKAGEKVQKWAENATPLTEEEKNSVAGKIGSFVGGVAPARG
jgi:hypothetical protein